MDLLVRLYELPPFEPVAAALALGGITIRRALVPEREAVTTFARAHDSAVWVPECEAAFSRLPVTCFVAVEQDTLLGFACYDATCRGFFGPELVHPDRRRSGIGRGLLLAALHAMYADGYAYGIIGWASSIDFYRRAVGATPIEGSEPGIYRQLLR